MGEEDSETVSAGKRVKGLETVVTRKTENRDRKAEHTAKEASTFQEQMEAEGQRERPRR